MRTVQLHHDPRLGCSPAFGPEVPAGWAAAAGADTLVTFRRPPAGGPAEAVGGVNATTRFLDPWGDRVAFYGLETDTALAPLVLWDAAHALPAGGTITLAGDPGVTPYLDRGYFRAGLARVAGGPAGATFRKTGPLPAEADRGLDRWTFGIPTGPGDATGLNAVVRRITELGCPESEILLCGRPGDNFRYWDRVRVVGEDLNRLPVPIAAKKNRLADEARYENLCLLHDRVFLPSDFLAAVKRFGDLFPVVGFQSLWFDDPWNLVGKRYSDYCRVYNPSPLLAAAAPAAGVYRPGLFAEVERGGFITANALRYNQGNYCTGSLYVCKRGVWRACPQDPRLNWQELEDVEHGLRGDRLGVPHRLNPHAFTQTLFTRPQLLCRGLLYETCDGRLVQSTNLLEEVRFRRKPMARASVAEAHRRLRAFCDRWVPRHLQDIHAAELSRPPADALTWGRQVGVAVYGAAVGFGAERVEAFLRDYETHLLFDQLNDTYRRYLVAHFGVHGPAAKDQLVEHGAVLRNMILYRRHGHLFYQSMAEYFPEPTRRLALGTRFTARRMARHDGQLFHHPGGRGGYRRAILNSTPFRGYHEG